MSDQIINNRYNVTNDIIRQTERLNQTSAKPVNLTSTGQTQTIESFQELLNRQLQKETTEVSFSKHANMRAKERNIEISSNDIGKLTDACDRASQKGIQDALIVMNDSAFIVNAKSKVVVTVVDKNEMKNNIFSNIEGAVFI